MYSFFEIIHHHLFHVLFAAVFYFVLVFFGKNISFLFLIIGTLLPDFDHFLNWFDSSDKTTKKVEHELEDGRRSIPKRIHLAIKDYWKAGFNKLLFHNMVSFMIVIFLLSYYRNNVELFSLLAGFFLHQIFDISGDIWRWKNINHWLWKP